ncbi:MAG TPA: phosphatase PAP2 family protein [Gemmatimonadaceae bacterium]|nr:phosphatase PAP2 family protein [Gemmatimonadaceae bacterium]
MTSPVRVEGAEHPPAPPERARWGLLIGGWILTLMLAAALALSLVSTGDWGVGLPWEHSVLRAFDDPLPRWLDIVMLIVPWFGTNITLLPITLLTAAWLYWRKHRSDLAAHLVATHAGVFALTMLGKMLFDRPRPALWEHRGQFAHASYPSGHLIASVAILFTYAVLLHRARGWRWPFVVAAVILLISAYSRIYLGVHWPSDVIAGLLMGAAWLAATLRAFPPRVVDRTREAS